MALLLEADAMFTRRLLECGWCRQPLSVMTGSGPHASCLPELCRQKRLFLLHFMWQGLSGSESCCSQAQVKPGNSCCRRSWALRRWGTARGCPWLLLTWRPLTSSASRRQGTAQASAAARSLQGEGCICIVRQQQWVWAQQQLALYVLYLERLHAMQCKAE